MRSIADQAWGLAIFYGKEFNFWHPYLKDYAPKLGRLSLASGGELAGELTYAYLRLGGALRERGPKGSGWKGPSRACRNARIPPAKVRPIAGFVCT